VDHIIVLAGGQISETGSYDQLLANNGKFAEFVREHASEKKEGEDELDTSTEHELRRATSVSSEAKSATLNRQQSTKEEQQKLIEVERAETGNVKWSVYLNYFRSLTWTWLSDHFTL